MTPEQKVRKFVEFLKEEIKAQHLDVSKFARAMKKPRQTVYSWLNDYRTMNLESYYQALEVLGYKEEIVLKNKQNE